MSLHGWDATVVRVIDGDTIVVTGRIRLTRSAAELGTAAGDAAAAKLRQNLKRGTRITVHAYAVDDYGRIIGALSQRGEPRGG